MPRNECLFRHRAHIWPAKLKEGGRLYTVLGRRRVLGCFIPFKFFFYHFFFGSWGRWGPRASDNNKVSTLGSPDGLTRVTSAEILVTDDT